MDTKKTFPYTFPPVRELLLEKYGPLFDVHSFDKLKEVIRKNSKGLTGIEKRVVRLRFNSEMRGTDIGSKLDMTYNHTYIYEEKALEKVLTHFMGRELGYMKAEQLLNMKLSDLSSYIPRIPKGKGNAVLKGRLSNIHNIMVKDLILGGRFLVDKGIIGRDSYEHLADFLAKHGVAIQSYKKHFDYTAEKYKNALSLPSIKKVAHLFHKHQKFLEPLEVDIVRMRLDNYSLAQVKKEVGLSRERISKIEDNALAKLNFYKEYGSKNYSIDELVNMKVSQFVMLVPPDHDARRSRIKDVLSEYFGDYNLSFLVEHPAVLAKCPNFHYNSYDSFRKILNNHHIPLPDVEYFRRMKRYFKVHQ